MTCPRFLGVFWRIHAWGPWYPVLVDRGEPRAVGLARYEERRCQTCRLTDRRPG